MLLLEPTVMIIAYGGVPKLEVCKKKHIVTTS